MKEVLHTNQKVALSSASFSMAAVLFMVMLVQTFFPNEFASPLIVLIGLTVLIFATKSRKQDYFRMAWPLWAVFVIGLHGVFNHEARHILRDVVYTLSPIALTFLGYWMAGSNIRMSSIFKILMVCGFVLAINHLMAFVENPALLLDTDVAEVRWQAGTGTGGLVLLGLILAAFQYRYGLGNLLPGALPRFVVMPVLMASFVLSYSRTETLMFLVLLVAVMGWFTKIRLKSVLRFLALVAAAFIIVITTPDDESGTLRSKFARSFAEITASNVRDERDINTNWRAYETARVMVSVVSSTVPEQVFGQGFGALVDLGVYMKLGNDELEEIPIFHNGYAYILIKTGVLGLLCYAFFYLYLIRFAASFSNSVNIEQRFLARLLLGCVLSQMLMMFVVGGMAETAGPSLVLLMGYLARRIKQLQRQVI